MSHLLQMRGLKLERLLFGMKWCKVASFTDAWIETSCIIDDLKSKKSHLLQMRGLKPFRFQDVLSWEGRIFYRCVDWNLIRRTFWPLSLVASFTDAWIETWRIGTYLCHPQSHLLQMRGLKLYNCKPARVVPKVASFTDAWIETNLALARAAFICRIFYRCVDWNRVHLCHALHDLGRIFYRCVDWNCCREYC